MFDPLSSLQVAPNLASYNTWPCGFCRILESVILLCVFSKQMLRPLLAYRTAVRNACRSLHLNLWYTSSLPCGLDAGFRHVVTLMVVFGALFMAVLS